jgi:hypothetical protein
MRVIVYDEAGDVAFDYYTQRDTISLCPGRLEKAQVVEALQEAAFFIMDAPVPSPEARNFRQHVFEGDHGEWLPVRFAANIAKLPEMLKR